MFFHKRLAFFLKARSSENRQASVSARNRLAAGRFVPKIGPGGLFLVLAVLGLSSYPALAGDSLYGKVTEVRTAGLVVLDYGAGKYNVRIIGIDPPANALLARQGRQLVSDLVLGKNARLRFGGRNKRGEMVGRLMTDDPVIGIKDVGVELLRSGLATRQKGEDVNFGYRAAELSKAENEAQLARRGLWANRRIK
ncbi:MAG: thermonuclease family protein [Acidobacteriota bacterium]|nr:thermonuclease family protein [Acidobacteriota bacterium]